MVDASVGSQKIIKKGPWLVKSGDRIAGPYSTEALAQLIRDKEVVVIDEIMAPQARWTYVRDVEAFATVVEEMRRGLMNSREDTEVQGYTSPVQKSTVTRATTPTVTNGATITTTSPVDLTGENDDAASVTKAENVTVTATVPDFKPAPAPPPQKPTLVKSPAQMPGPTTPNENVNRNGPTAAPAKNLTMAPLSHHTKDVPPSDPLAPPKQYVRPSIGSGGSGLILGALVLIAVVTFIIYSVLKAPHTTSVVNTDNLQTQASVAWKRGEFDRALELYRSLNHDQPGDPLVAARLATLLMKIEGQTVEAKRVIESAKDNAKDDEQKSALSVASGLAALQTDDPRTAVTEFASASNTWIASFNEGVAYTMLKEWPKAASSFDHAGENAVALLMLARTHLSAAEAGSVPKVAARRQADEAIKKALLQSPDYQQESLLIASYIDVVSGNAKRATKEVLEAVETDPNQTNDHFHDPSLNLEQVSWTKLLTYCQALHKEMNTRVSGAMLGLCLAKANQIEDATKTVELELGKEPTNTYLHAVNAYLHTVADREDAARASLTLSAKNGTSRLAEILSARLCTREKQDACAEEAWSKLASESNPPIAAVTGLAQMRLAKGDTSTANALLVKAESMSPKYLPLLRLREEASR
jgi:Tfp pilus assembly protein PilF